MREMPLLLSKLFSVYNYLRNCYINLHHNAIKTVPILKIEREINIRDY